VRAANLALAALFVGFEISPVSTDPPAARRVDRPHAEIASDAAQIAPRLRLVSFRGPFVRPASRAGARRDRPAMTSRHPVKRAAPPAGLVAARSRAPVPRRIVVGSPPIVRGPPLAASNGNAAPPNPSADPAFVPPHRNLP
jgi:hypothetical protein